MQIWQGCLQMGKALLQYIVYFTAIMKKGNIILIHIAFWLIRLAPYFPGGRSSPLLSVSFNAVAAVTFYINYLFIMPWFFQKKKYGWAAVAWVVLLFFFIFSRYLIEEIIYPAWLGIHNYYRGVTLQFYIKDNLNYAGVVIISSIMIWLLISFIKSVKENADLKTEKAKAEINFLKSQVSPHFLFNNLNNIYSLVYHGSDKALPAIQRLSEMMRYLTKGAKADHVLLSQELQYIRDYIALHSLRVSGTSHVVLVAGVLPYDPEIPPLLLIPFVENGFKHGVVTLPEQPFTIEVSLNGTILYFRTHNKINRHQKDAVSGIGLHNLKKRLELLFPAKHILTITSTGDCFNCEMTLKLV
ncbi:sensor histidine kinase [Niabella soli]|uniref:sensor histidine kinase n=1 Tax=Niabella soli TaxID=446683 RepID=UPI0002499A97|nr:histidine kinase [Niabella soli]